MGKKDEASQQWTFVHSLCKNMVINTINCINRLRIGNHDVFIKRGNQLLKPEIRQLYYMVMVSIEEWEKEHCGGKTPQQLTFLKPAIQIGFTMVDKDWAYERLAKIFLKTGREKTKEDMEKWLEDEIPAPERTEGKFTNRKREEYKE